MSPRRLALALALLAACAAGRQEILSRTMAGLGAAEKAFVAYDAKQQEAIVASATSREDGAAKLLAWRARRDRVAATFVTAYGALAVASLDLTDEALTAAGRTTAAVLAALRNLGVL